MDGHVLSSSSLYQMVLLVSVETPRGGLTGHNHERPVLTIRIVHLHVHLLVRSTGPETHLLTQDAGKRTKSSLKTRSFVRKHGVVITHVCDVFRKCATSLRFHGLSAAGGKTVKLPRSPSPRRIVAMSALERLRKLCSCSRRNYRLRLHPPPS